MHKQRSNKKLASPLVCSASSHSQRAPRSQSRAREPAGPDPASRFLRRLRLLSQYFPSRCVLTCVGDKVWHHSTFANGYGVNGSRRQAVGPMVPSPCLRNGCGMCTCKKFLLSLRNNSCRDHRSAWTASCFSHISLSVSVCPSFARELAKLLARADRAGSTAHSGSPSPDCWLFGSQLQRLSLPSVSPAGLPGTPRNDSTNERLE